MFWYDGNKTLTYNALFNFIVGNRGGGKTYWAKKWAIKDFLKNGKQFIYLRRYEDELKETKESYFDDILFNNEYDNLNLKYDSDCYMINDRLAGYCMALSKAQNYKSSSFPCVKYIIFEEFLIEENGFKRYLSNEVEMFLSFYLSIDRYRGDTIVLFLSNSTSMTNPYTVYWDLYLPYGSNIVRKGDVLLEVLNDTERINERKNSRFGKLIAGTSYEKYAIENKFVKDTKDFIRKKTATARYYFTIRYSGENYGIWIDWTIGKMYVSKDVDPSCRIIYTLRNDDHTENTMLIKSISKSNMLKLFVDCYKDGNVYFESVRVKNMVYDVIKMCIK
jgi:hypothetical protein